MYLTTSTFSTPWSEWTLEGKPNSSSTACSFKKMQHCVCSIVICTLQVHHHMTKTINSSMDNKSPTYQFYHGFHQCARRGRNHNNAVTMATGIKLSFYVCFWVFLILDLKFINDFRKILAFITTGFDRSFSPLVLPIT